MSKIATVENLIEINNEKLSLLREWQENIKKAKELSNINTKESDKYDDRCIEIEEHFEAEYDLEFDSYGELTRGSKATTVETLIDHINNKLELLNEWMKNAEAEQELADGACLDETDRFDESFEELEEALASYDINLNN